MEGRIGSPADVEPLTHIPWQVFAPYFRQLAFGAAQQLLPNPRLSDVLFHEYSRTFALCLCACPEGAVPMINRLTEARLIVDPAAPTDLAARVRGQLAVLGQSFEVSTLGFIDELLTKLLTPEIDTIERATEITDADASPEWATEALTGIREHLAQLQQVYAPVKSLRELALSLSTTARDLGLLYQPRIDELISDLKSGSSPSPSGDGSGPLYPHSLAFWRSALGELRKLAFMQEQPGDQIRPEVVLLSRELAAWAARQDNEIRDRFERSRIFQPQRRLYSELLQRVKRAAEGFASGVAVQNNLVVSILGHHLLEDLDLHVLELREIARNLDPRGLNRPPVRSSTSATASDEAPWSRLPSWFSTLLVSRAQQALSLPKNLRALGKVLDPDGARSSSFSRDRIAPPSGWTAGWSEEPGLPVPIIDSRARELLALVLSELQQNHRIHSGLGDTGEQPKARWAPETGAFILESPFLRDPKGDRWRRLQEVQAIHLQQPLSPNPDHLVPSTGVGLYLSCLAAAIAGWNLTLHELRRDEADDEKGWCVFKLEPQQKPTQLTAAESQLKTEAPAHGSAPPRPNPACRASASAYHDVVVIDDKPAVALYAWREAGAVTGLGSAALSEDTAKQCFLEDGAPASIDSPDGATRFWWIAAGKNWRGDLAKMRPTLTAPEGGTQRITVLLDVRGPVGPSSYDFTEVLTELHSWPESPPVEVRLISSYRHGSHAGKAIEPKTPETFATLVACDPGAQARTGSGESQGLPRFHILVTGAGFERAGKPASIRLGIPSTRDLIRSWFAEAFPGEWPTAREHPSFPLTERMIEANVYRNAGESGVDLDLYWTQLFRGEAKRFKGAILEAALHELRLRETFRRQLLWRDWGHLNQTLVASELDWTAWLSTNYTRFANRAIEQLQHSSAGDASRRDWRVIETQEEVDRLEREVLHARSDRNGEGSRPAERTLFKLHGDISHVLTMALTSDDKAYLTRLPGFARLYLAARFYLLQLGSTQQPHRWIWHIVGHGLKDEPLLELIKAVVGAGKAHRHRHELVVVDPAKSRHPVEYLRQELSGDQITAKVHASQLTAEQYMTRLASVGIDRWHEVILPPAEPH